MKTSRLMLLLPAIAVLAALPAPLRAQSPADSSSTASSTGQADLLYTRPTQKTKFHNYLLDGFGPFPIVGAAFVSGINQATNSPPEWKQGAEAYGKRFGSNYGIAAVGMTTRYALAEAFQEDTSYYHCACKGVFPRLGHALISTLTARRGDDGHRVFSFPALVAPYAGTMTAVYAWYPDRYDARDGFRMGNYSLLGYAGSNVAMEFLERAPRSLLYRLRRSNRKTAPAPK